MMAIVKSLEEAMNFFLHDHENPCLCENEKGEQRECKSYLEAKEFYKQA